MTTKQAKLNNRDGSVITFYSYKGGVGRTMALANLACLMSKAGKKILTIDWDLEAPGLHHFFKDKDTEQQGLIDLMTDVKSKIDEGKIENSDDGFVFYFNENLTQYISKDFSFKFIEDEKGYVLDLLKSGRFNSAYTTKLNDFDWIKFYKNSPSFFRTFASYLESKYDYILIDSRTGFADTSGICTMLMPERLVLVFSPNDQNIEGVLNVARQAREYRLNSYDKRTLAVFPLPARIDSNNPDKRIEWLNKYTSTFQKFFVDNYYLEECPLKNYFEKATIRYTHHYAYGETISVLKEAKTEKLSIANDYENFLNILLSDEPIWELKSSEEIEKNEKDSMDSYIKGVGFQSGKEHDKAITSYTKAIEKKPDFTLAYNNRGIAYKNLQRYDDAIADFTKAIELKPDFADAFNNRGIAYSDIQRYDDAIADFTKAIELNTDFALAYNNRGIAYKNLQRYDDAIADYTKAIELKPDFADAFNNRKNAYKNLQRYDKAIADFTNINMNDLDIIKQIEQTLDTPLILLDKIEWNSNGYTVNKNGQVTSLTLYGFEIKNFNSIILLIKEFKQLTNLDLSYNREIEDFSFIKELNGLTYLDLSNNNLKNVSFIKELNKLAYLDLSENKWISNVSFLKELKELTYLNLSNNNISDISFIKELNKLTYLDLSYNPIKIPPEEIVAQGIGAIRNYFRQIEEQGKDFIYEAKLMLVGEPGAGKSTLMYKMFDRNYIVPNNDQTSTLGIDVRQNWTFKTENNIEFKANIWDFGGQHIQYMLHQFFLTSDCLYVLMAEKRRELANFDYWLNIINILGKNSPVIILFNEINLTTASSYIFDEKKYRELFPELDFICKDINLSNMKDARFDILINEIKTKLISLKHIGKPVPARWIDIRKELNGNRNKKHININEYYDICLKNGINNADDSKLILITLHSLGAVLNFQDDIYLRDTIFLDHNWTVDAVYVVLTNESIKNNNGVFKRDEVYNIWNAKGYKQDEQTKLLQLMLKDNFDLCYKVPESQDEYIVPLLLPKIMPEYNWDEKNNLQFRFQYPFMPEGIISRLIVRLHEYIEKRLVWNEGVVLSKNDAWAQIIETKTIKEGIKIIDIRLTGNPNYRKELLDMIREEIRKIQKSSFPNLPYYEMVPCRCSECSKSSEPEFYDYPSLENFLFKKNKKTRECPRSGEDVEITIIIDAVYKKEDEKRRDSNIFRSTDTYPMKKIFISYSKTDTEYLRQLENYLSVLKRQKYIATWHDRKLTPGEEWDGKIRAELEEADIILFLVSSDFLATDYIWDIEMKKALELHEKGKAKVVPIIIRDCDWEDSPLGKFTSPEKAMAISKSSDRDEAWKKIIKDLKKIIKT